MQNECYLRWTLSHPYISGIAIPCTLAWWRGYQEAGHGGTDDGRCMRPECRRMPSFGRTNANWSIGTNSRTTSSKRVSAPCPPRVQQLLHSSHPS
ncbi:hypothetical protein PENSPDRAFT_201049 [Peniophora sp. CONT]|nr:hypothetical protein PENSPDRAFT_201049 [Peniophora sp. CONT]